ncbi:MAG TPA: hypothetical protein DEG71_03590 [Clostridiales bacterium]|nr:hypothetical protein [Clostridiales bacterium]
MNKRKPEYVEFLSIINDENKLLKILNPIVGSSNNHPAIKYNTNWFYSHSNHPLYSLIIQRLLDEVYQYWLSLSDNTSISFCKSIKYIFNKHGIK